MNLQTLWRINGWEQNETTYPRATFPMVQARGSEDEKSGNLGTGPLNAMEGDLKGHVASVMWG